MFITWQRAQAALEQQVAPAIRGHGGDVRIVSVSEAGQIVVEFLGACAACPLKPVTFGTAVQIVLERVEGVTSVRCDSVRVSPHAIRRMRDMMQRTP
jgi:Fe-S cluster biogenesis protein NfuA